jgi:hypothetical protein
MNSFLKTSRAALLLLLPSAFIGCTSAPQNSTENAANIVLPTPASTRAATSKPNANKIALFLPDDNGKLRSVAVDDELQHGSTDSYDPVAEQLIFLLMQKSPRDFPKGAKTLDVPRDFPDDKKTVAVNFNKAFADEKFWQGATQTRVTIYAIVNTIAQYVIDNSGNSAGEIVPTKVRFLIEGKPIQTLGDFDVSDALAPDMTLVAKP